MKPLGPSELWQEELGGSVCPAGPGRFQLKCGRNGAGAPVRNHGWEKKGISEPSPGPSETVLAVWRVLPVVAAIPVRAQQGHPVKRCVRVEADRQPRVSLRFWSNRQVQIRFS